MSNALVVQLIDRLAQAEASITAIREQLAPILAAPDTSGQALLAMDQRVSELERTLARWREDDRYSITRAQVVRILSELHGNAPDSRATPPSVL